MSFKCYSQRLLNPFRGMLNIIEFNSAEAVTMNGVEWDIYVRNSALVKDLELSQSKAKRIQTSEIRFGRWSKKTGLKRGPTIDSDDFQEMAATGEQVYQYLVRHCDTIPFPYQDNYELWLLDKNNKPLALLHSEVYPEDILLTPNITWTAGITCQQTFTCKSNLIKTASTSNNSAHYLNQLINSYSNNSAQWLMRNSDRTGTGLDGVNLDATLINRKLSAQEIPSLIINYSVFTKEQQSVLDDYFTWLAPWLLVQHSLSDKSRAKLEKQARTNALIIEKNYRLYPKIIDQRLIQSALVEAVLRQNQTALNNTVEGKVESVEYLESNNPTFHLNK